MENAKEKRDPLGLRGGGRSPLEGGLLGPSSKPLDKTDIALCAKCQCTWFEEVRVGRYSAMRTHALGQKLYPADGGVLFSLLRCIKCGALHEPRLSVGTGDGLRRFHEDLEEIVAPGVVQEP